MNKAIKILFLASEPIDSDKLQLGMEVREIDLALRRSPHSDRFELENHWAVRISDFQELLLRHRPHIVHFSGHGSPQGEIILEDEVGNRSIVSVSVLSKLFSILKGNIRCVILNACYSETQAQAIAKYVDCVIGISNAISDQSAIRFSSAFYQVLGYGRNLKTAFELGCLAVESTDPGNEDAIKLIGDEKNLANTYLLSEIAEPQLKEIYSFLDAKQYKGATQLCKSILESHPQHAEANLIIAICYLKGQPSEQHIRAKVKQVEGYLNKAAQFPSTANAARVIMGLVKYDHYRYEDEGEPTLDEIKHSIKDAELTQCDNYYISHVNASPEAYSLLGITQPSKRLGI